jgi:5-methyltetrahydropteroyltriglutamate--homocysteine methyltransferase
MKRSTDAILTTHVGRLQRPDTITEKLVGRYAGKAVDQAALDAELKASVAEVVRQQADAGIRVVNDGEFGRISWLIYAHERLSGFEQRPVELKYATAILKGKDREEFADYYSEFATRGGLTYYKSPGAAGSSGGMRDHQPVCIGPVAYRGQALLRAEIDALKSALGKADAAEAFMTSTAPGDIVYAAPNDHYRNEEDYLYAIANAMKEEYHAIVDAGLVLQIDDPMIPAYWDLMLTQGVDIAKYHRYCEARIEALNHALADIPRDRIRYHICWGSHHGPHVSDIPIRDVIPMLFKVRASGLLFEAANSRHEHEWQAWRDVKLPDDTVLIPGVIGHATNTVEHPELVAWRIKLFAETVGKENVIAGTDCGMGYRVHPQIAWAKLKALGEGARLASRELWPGPH